MTEEKIWLIVYILWGITGACILSYFFEKFAAVLLAIAVISALIYFMLIWPLMKVLE